MTTTASISKFPHSGKNTWETITNSSFYLFCASIPFVGYDIRAGGFEVSPSNVIIAITLATTTIHLLIRGDVKLTETKVYSLLVTTPLLLLVVVHATLGNSVPLGFAISFMGSIAAFSITLVFIDSPRKLYNALAATMFGIVVFSLIGILAGFGVIPLVARTPPNMSVGGIQPPFIRTLGGPMSYGSYGFLVALPTITSVIYGITSAELPTRVSAGVTFAICSLGILIAQSRSTFLAIFLSFVVAGHYVAARSEIFRFNITRIYSIGMITSTVVAIPVGYLLYKARPETLSIRLELLAVAVQEIYSNPVLGTSRSSLQGDVVGGHTIHNMFLETGVLFGLPGLILVCTIWIIAFRVCYQSVKYRAKSVLPVVLLATIISGWAENMLYPGLLPKTTWFMLGLIIAGGSTIIDEGVTNRDRTV